MSRAEANTPLIQQYLDIKARHPDSILFFRVGDFYEMFFDDAEEGSRLLGITLTSRNNGGSGDVPLAGVPAKALDDYLPRLVRQGRRVAICEQVEDASQAEGIVRREVTEIVTPGATLEDSLLNAGRNNFVAAVAGTGPVGIATADLSTGEVEVRECSAAALADELDRLEPAEVVRASDGAHVPPGAWMVTDREPWRFAPDVSAEVIKRVYRVRDVAGFGLDESDADHMLSAVGAVLGYLEEVRPAGTGHLKAPRVERSGRYLHLDEMTRRNLEVVESIRGDSDATLLRVLDRTLTPMGRRMLRRRLLAPLVDLKEIEARLEAVAELHEAAGDRRAMRESLRHIQDLERLAAKISAGRVQPRELLALARSLGALPAITQAAGDPKAARLRDLLADFDVLDDVRDAIEEAIDPEAPALLSAGGVIRDGYSSELDELRSLRDGAVDWIAGLQQSEREATGIDNLKIGYNKVFGYYIEVTRSHLGKVPDRYLRKQTLTNAERYITPELKEWEEKILDAETGIAAEESRLFAALRESLESATGRLQDTAERVAALDVHSTLADVAERNDYVRPRMNGGFGLEIRAGRHPVVEQMIAREDFIPNNVTLERDAFAMILTGPNMAGKSTVLRQIGLIALMAQSGSFVPADEASLGVCDRIFTRVGASDSLARGQSTFMVEMIETAAILSGATDRSLILLDEIGRGTSTYDGVAIAWAVTEFIHDRIGARTVFATHYHELVELADKLDGVTAWNVAVRETGEDIVFLRRLEPGGCDRSYGVHVARLAGVPREVIDRAFAVLHELEDGPGGGTRLSHLGERERGQLTLFDLRPSRLTQRVAGLDLERMTPIEALVELEELRRLADEEGA
ncbi:MAG: DNA mismatch repair protein MutS [marine benthic group bacterium]|nr:DNA mismatch repair protein MutS [Candidatus Benthicola marisminoris]